MGTHVYIFSQDNAIPTLRQLFDLAEKRGYRLKLSPDHFEDEDEEAEFLDEFMDSSEWRDVSFANQADLWVLHSYYLRRSDSHFTQRINEFRNPLIKINSSPEELQVIEHLEAVQVYYDIQIGLIGEDIWRPQEAIIGYFQGRDTDLIYLENIDVYEKNRKVILRPRSNS
jgi:hypothetical protein